MLFHKLEKEIDIYFSYMLYFGILRTYLCLVINFVEPFGVRNF